MVFVVVRDWDDKRSDGSISHSSNVSANRWHKSYMIWAHQRSGPSMKREKESGAAVLIVACGGVVVDSLMPGSESPALKWGDGPCLGNQAKCVFLTVRDHVQLISLMRNNVSLLLSPPFSLPEGVRAVRQRVRQEICWTNNLRSSTTSSTQSLIQLASCVWCPETTYSTGSTTSDSQSHSTSIAQTHFSFEKTNSLEISAFVRKSTGIVAHVWTESFLHCFAISEAACESTLLNKLSKAKMLKPLSIAYSDWASCLSVCGRQTLMWF